MLCCVTPCAAATIVYFLFIGITSYNMLVSYQVHVDRAWSQVSVQIKRRHDLILNLVQLAEKYARGEEATLRQVVAARNAAIMAHQIPEQVKAERALTTVTDRFFLIVEAYPDLKADGMFLELQREWRDTENQIARTRADFNNAVATYNSSVRQFPHFLIACMFRFYEASFFQLAEMDV